MSPQLAVSERAQQPLVLIPRFRLRFLVLPTAKMSTPSGKKKLPTDRVLEESLDFDYSMSNSQDVTEALLMQVENQHRIEEKRKTPGARTPAGVRTRTAPGSATARGAGSANTARAAAAALASAADEHRSEKAAAAAMASAADELRADKDMGGGGGLASTAVTCWNASWT